MKFGANTQIWAAPFTQADIDLIDKVAGMGFGLIELGFAAVEPPFDVAQVKQRLDDHGLSCSVCSFQSADRDIANEDADIRRAGVDYMKAMVATTAALGGEIFSGPLYGELFRARHLPADERQAEWERSVKSMREIAKSAETQGVVVAVEPLNRFETDLLNLSEQAVRYCDDVGSSAVGILLDTFHMAIEEKNQSDAIRLAGKHLKHLHSCENDRGSPGSGQVPWADVREALKAIQYDAAVVIEGFNPEVVDLANGARIWRPMAPSPDRLASDGIAYLKRLFK